MLVACSGGPDSACLLAVLQQLAPELGLRLTAASVDHGLRAGAAADVALARAQAQHVGVPFRGLTVSVQEGASLQAQARTARYAALAALAGELGASRVAVGHTRDDQAETVLMRLLRGASVRGVGGIQPRRGDGVVRPLIDCERAAVHAHAHAQFPQIASDPSNGDAAFLRVRVRQQILPGLRAEDPAIDSHLAALADDVREVGLVIDAAAAQLLGQATDGDRLAIAVLRGAPAALQRVALRDWVLERAGHEPGRAVLAQLTDLLRGRGEVRIGGGATVRVSGKHLRFERDDGSGEGGAY